jgi:acyl-CoA thioester hydrolase
MNEYVATAEVEVRVRYHECDPMNVAHHAVYPVWLEIARTELLRQRGMAYRDCEAAGIFFVVARMSIKYQRPARYDDVLRVVVKARPSAGVKVEHDYEIFRTGDNALLTTASTTLVCVDRQGKACRIPAEVLGEQV